MSLFSFVEICYDIGGEMCMKEIVNPLLEWYQNNSRVLPWREDSDPYHVWISEVMLQQTRIEAVIPYYERFMTELPTIFDLSQVEDDYLMKLWEGLGYYNRARNLKRAACEIVEKYQGVFPGDFASILSLPGIGEYTASAIASICFSLPEVTIDGNVLRVYMRLTNCDDNIDLMSVRKKVRLSLMKIVPKESGIFNQALMELGEVICLPNGMPKCDICPLREFCKARVHHTFLDLPVRKPKALKKNQNYTVLLLTCGNKVALRKRVNTGLLQDLWEFPNIYGKLDRKEVIQYLIDCSITVEKITSSISYIHIFTHVKWQMNSFLVEVLEECDEFVWVDMSELLKNYALPGAFQPFLKVLMEGVVI